MDYAIGYVGTSNTPVLQLRNRLVVAATAYSCENYVALEVARQINWDMLQ